MAASQGEALIGMIKVLTTTAALLTIVIELWNVTSPTIRFFSVADLVLFVFVSLVCYIMLRSDRLGDRGLHRAAFFLLWPFLVLLGLAVSAPVMAFLGIVFLPTHVGTSDWWDGMGITFAGLVATALLAWRLALLTKPRIRA